MSTKPYRISKEQENMSIGYRSLGGQYNRFGIGVAYAGAGKTTTVIDMAWQYFQENPGNGKVLYLVFSAFMKNEIQGKLGKKGSWFETFPVERMETSTLHGFMRKKLEERYGDRIGFYHKSGHIDYTVFTTILERLWGTKEFDGTFMRLMVDKMTDFSLVTDRAKDFDFSIDFEEYHFNRLFGAGGKGRPLMEAIAKHEGGFDIDFIGFGEGGEIMESLARQMATAIFEGGLIRDMMPHGVYYKYALQNLDIANVDIFEGYDNVIIDEAQDLDQIITAMCEASKRPIFMLGDPWQMIYRFRGAFNSLEYMQKKYDVEPHQLTKSYRLSPENAFVATAFLNQYANDLGLRGPEDKPLQIYGNSRQKSSRLFRSESAAEFSRTIVDRFVNLDIAGHEIYQYESQKSAFAKQVESFYPKGRKLAVRRDLKKAAEKLTTKEETKKEDRTAFVAAFVDAVQGRENVMELHRRFPLLEILDDEKGTISPENIKRAMYGRRRRNLVREIVNDAGQYAFISRNNAKALEMIYNILVAIPKEKVRDVPVIYLRYETSIDEKMKALDAMNMKYLPGTDRKKALLDTMTPLLAQRYGKGTITRIVNEKISAASIYDTFSAALHGSKRPPLFAAGDFVFNPTESDEDLAHFASKIAPFIDTESVARMLEETGRSDEVPAFEALMRKHDRTAPIFYLVEQLGTLPLRLKTFTPYQAVGIGPMVSGIDERAVAAVDNDDFRSFYYYTRFVQMKRDNPNVQVTTKNDFNIYVSTAHKTKGLEFENVMLANDLSLTDDEEMDDEQKRDEFNLAYVAMTRAKSDIYYEKMPDGRESPFMISVKKSVANFERRYFSPRAKVTESASGNMLKFEVETARDFRTEVFLGEPSPVYTDIVIDADLKTQRINEVYFRNRGGSIPTGRDNANLEYVVPEEEGAAELFENMKALYIGDTDAEMNAKTDAASPAEPDASLPSEDPAMIDTESEYAMPEPKYLEDPEAQIDGEYADEWTNYDPDLDRGDGSVPTPMAAEPNTQHPQNGDAGTEEMSDEEYEEMLRREGDNPGF